MNKEEILLLVSLPEKLLLEGPVRNTSNEKFLKVTNKGKDIGGKLLLMDLVIKLYSQVPYLILLHDKRSYQKQSGRFEKEKLFEIITPKKFNEAIRKFESDDSIGIICEKGAIKNEFNEKENNFNTTNSEILKRLLKEYQLSTDDYRFAAGTMFWVRTSVMVEFFSKHNPVKVRATLEGGNTLDHDNGTITHSWERLLSWIATSSGYKIAGI